MTIFIRNNVVGRKCNWFFAPIHTQRSDKSVVERSIPKKGNLYHRGNTIHMIKWNVQTYLHGGDCCKVELSQTSRRCPHACPRASYPRCYAYTLRNSFFHLGERWPATTVTEGRNWRRYKTLRPTEMKPKQPTIPRITLLLTTCMLRFLSPQRRPHKTLENPRRNTEGDGRRWRQGDVTFLNCGAGSGLGAQCHAGRSV